MTPSILIVDDGGFMRYALTGLLEQDGIARVAAAGTRAEALTLVGALRPDVIVVDTTCGGIGDLALISRLTGLRPPARLVAVVPAHDAAAVAAARCAGAEFTLGRPYDPAETATLLQLLRAAPIAL